MALRQTVIVSGRWFVFLGMARPLPQRRHLLRLIMITLRILWVVLRELISALVLIGEAVFTLLV